LGVLCWAHLIRDVKFLTTLSDRVTRRYGPKLLTKIKCLFRISRRREQIPREKRERAGRRAAEAVLHRVKRAPQRSEAQNIAQRVRDHGAHYFTFLKLPGVEPTNNAMEQRMRFVAIDRKITQGTRGERGRRWCERMWTVLPETDVLGESPRPPSLARCQVDVQVRHESVVDAVSKPPEVDPRAAVQFLKVHGRPVLPVPDRIIVEAWSTRQACLGGRSWPPAPPARRALPPPLPLSGQ